MRAFFVHIFFVGIILNSLFIIQPVLADYSSAYSDYTFNFTKYRETHNGYQIAKSTYATYRTLTAKDDATAKLRTVLQTRAKLMASYFDLLYEKILATPNIPSENQNTFFKVKENEKKWLSQHQKKLDAASGLEDLNSASGEFETRFAQMDTESKQAIGTILLSKTTNLSTSWDNETNLLQEQLKTIAAAGENITNAQAGIISARNKKELAETKFSAAQKIFAGSEYGGINLFSAQQKLTEGIQYLREATQYLQEIVKSFTG